MLACMMHSALLNQSIFCSKTFSVCDNYKASTYSSITAHRDTCCTDLQDHESYLISTTHSQAVIIYNSVLVSCLSNSSGFWPSFIDVKLISFGLVAELESRSSKDAMSP